MSRLVPCALLLALAACRTSPWSEHRYVPAPLETQVTTQSDPDAQVRALVSILGRARADGSVHVRLRLENLGRSPARLVPEKLSLVTSDLLAFGTPGVTGLSAEAIAPGETAVCDLTFPTPAQALDDRSLRALNLRWTIDFSGVEVTTGATFERSDWDALYDEPRVNVGVGVGWWNG